MQNSSPVRVAIVGGCGHVGLPLGIVIASNAQYDVTLVDINQEAVNRVNQGEMHFIEEGGPEALKSVIGKTLRATTQVSAVQAAEYVIFVTGTPVDEHLNPRVSDLLKIITHYLPYLNLKQTVILRSTVYPGSTQSVFKMLSEKVPGIRLAFCPERVAQGLAITEIKHLPQIISAFNIESEESAVRLFGSIASEIIRLTPEEAELTKLFANGWRYLQFAIANQFYMMTESCGIDFQRVYQALTYHYPRAKDFAGPGFTAGPCLFKDTMQLAAFHNNHFFMGHAAMLINEGLPNFIVQQLTLKMKDLAGKKIGLLGMAFKPNNDDTRESLSYKVKKILESRLAVVLDTDRYQASHSKLQTILRNADGFILGVPHREYSSLDLQGKPFVDCWGYWNGKPNLQQSPWVEAEVTGRTGKKIAA